MEDKVLPLSVRQEPVVSITKEPTVREIQKEPLVMVFGRVTGDFTFIRNVIATQLTRTEPVVVFNEEIRPCR